MNRALSHSRYELWRETSMPVQRKIFRIEETMRARSGLHGADTPGDAEQPADVIAELRAMRALMEQHRPDGIGPLTRTAEPSPDVRKLRIELDVIGSAIRETRAEIGSLQDQGFDSGRVARVTRELEAVFNDTTGATERILKAAEDIDQNAQTLANLLKGGHEQGLAQDIQERVTAIFEACNFHDLTGQRIARVADTLKLVEDHLARMMEIWSVIERFNVDTARSTASRLDGLINGPELGGPDGDKPRREGPSLSGDRGHSTQAEIDKLFH
jgi:chemotaxis protein CheZ